jgi:hypothetical protein
MAARRQFLITFQTGDEFYTSLRAVNDHDNAEWTKNYGTRQGMNAEARRYCKLNRHVIRINRCHPKQLKARLKKLGYSK